MMTNDIGSLFAVFQANYGQRWTHGADAIPVWLQKLRHFQPAEIMKAAEKAIDVYLDWPPSLGEFSSLVRNETPKLTGPNQDNATLAGRVSDYTKPYQERSNPKGNPHKISLPESIAQRQPGESAEEYRKRISDAMTFAMYSQLGPDGLFKHGSDWG